MSEFSNKGWIALHRNFLDSQVWSFSDATLRVAVYLLLSVNHESKWYRGILVERGSCVRSISNISEFCKLTRKSVRLAIKNLEKAKFISKSLPFGAKQSPLLSICKFDTYQSKESNKGNGGIQGSIHTGAMEVSNVVSKEVSTNNNENNKNNYNNENKRVARTREGFESLVKPLFESLNAISEFQNFCDYWCNRSVIDDRMKWESDEYFNPALKVRSWLDRLKPKQTTKPDIQPISPEAYKLFLENYPRQGNYDDSETRQAWNEAVKIVRERGQDEGHILCINLVFSDFKKVTDSSQERILLPKNWLSRQQFDVDWIKEREKWFEDRGELDPEWIKEAADRIGGES